MKFWDASAIVPLLVAETQTRQLLSIAAKDSVMLVWWGSEVECNSALARRERDGALNARAMTLALRRLRQLTDAWHQIDPSDAIREAAIRFLRVHPLRAADAVQLAAAFVAAERRPPTLEMVTLDDRLANAARREGFAMIDPTPVD
jgi:predicted nucleic acid-binding protein